MDTGGKFAAGVFDTSGNLPPVSLTPVSTTPAVPAAKFAAGVVDTGGKFATSKLIPAVHLHFRISPRNSE
jgi:hypothetical protein